MTEFFNENSQSFELSPQRQGGMRQQTNEVAGQFLEPPGVTTSCKRQIGHPIRTRSGETGSVTFYREKHNFTKMLPLRGKLISAGI